MAQDDAPPPITLEYADMSAFVELCKVAEEAGGGLEMFGAVLAAAEELLTVAKKTHPTVFMSVLQAAMGIVVENLRLMGKEKQIEELDTMCGLTAKGVAWWVNERAKKAAAAPESAANQAPAPVQAEESLDKVVSLFGSIKRGQA